MMGTRVVSVRRTWVERTRTVHGEAQMQAGFRFNGSEEIRVWTDASGVYVDRVRVGFDPKKHSKDDLLARIALSKSQARSVASAMMGAAAEL